MSIGHGGSGASDLLWEDARWKMLVMHMCVCVCVCVSVTRSSLLGNGLTRTRQGVSSQDEQGLFSGKPKCLARGSLRPTVKKLGSKMLLGRPDSGGAEGPGGRPPCPGQARLPGWWGQEASGAAAQGPGQCCMV